MLRNSQYFAKMRSLLYVPGVDKSKLYKDVNPDIICFDLEDSVPLHMKEEARDNITERMTRTITKSAALRINAYGTSNIDADLKILSKKFEYLVIPKVNTANELESVVSKINNKIGIIACIETAKGLLNIEEIAKCKDKFNLKALLFAAEDFVADLQMIRTEHRRELLYARSKVSCTAKAFGLQAIDMVCVQFRKEAILLEEAQEGREMGFTGKQVIHPAQIAHVHKIFSPTEAQIKRARDILNGFEQSNSKGKGAFELTGEVIDIPVVKWAQGVLDSIN